MKLPDSPPIAYVKTVLKKYGLPLLFIFLGLQGWGQSISNIHSKNFSVASDTLFLDSMSVVPGTLIISGPANSGMLDSSFYVIEPYQSLLIWKKKPAGDSVKIFFRTYPFSVAAATYHKSYASYLKASANSIARPFTYNPDEAPGKLVDFGSLDYNGSFSRSISFGNNQSVALNSMFNLQLSGMLTHDIEITAAITDNNVPIQPEGNTQQLQEFDKIFIQIRKDQQKVIVGDFDLASPDDYFLKFSRKYQGLYYSGAFKIKHLGVLKTQVAGGIVRGKFSSNVLAVTEGNQGPYTLIGASGETVITILANSERVFVNGQQMERGADRDYVIDYNLGQVTFTPKRIVSPDMRVVVEFQYANNAYQRSVAFLSTELQTKKVNVHFSLFSEQDSKGQNLQQSLTSGQQTFLSQLGDSIQKAFYRGYDTTTFDPNRILYQLTDTIITPYHFDSIFVYSTNPANAKYAVNFSFVGNNQGNYIPSTSSANGRVYQWVEPVFDTAHHVFVPQGSYDPVIFLTTPKYQQMYTLGADYHINKFNTISVEGAMSNNDQNMFSKINNNTNIGFGGHVAYKGTAITANDSAKKKNQSINYDVSYDFIQNTFMSIERFRNVEFARDWNITQAAQTYNQHLISGNASYLWAGLGSLTFHVKSLLEDTVYRGIETGLNGSFSKKAFSVTFANSYLNSSSEGLNTNFIRPKADFWISPKALKKWRIGAGYDHEINIFKYKGADTLSSVSYIWQNYSMYIASPDSSKSKYRFEVLLRYQQRPDSATGGFGKPYYAAQTINFKGTIGNWKNQTLNYTLTFRHAKNADSIAASSPEPENFYLGRVDYNITLLKGVIHSTTLYELGTGREQRTQVTYQVSPTNQGDYIWVDFNHNGIKEINEFVLSPYKTDTSYVQIFIPTPEYVSVNTNQFNEVLNINPAAVWKNTKGIRKIVSLFSAFASIQINKKTYVEPNKKVYEYLNPIPLKKEDTSIVATTISSRNSLYFNRLGPKFGMQFDYNYIRARNYLTGGFENNLSEIKDVILRWNVVKAFNTQTTYTNGLKANESAFYAGLKYRFTYNEINTDLSYQFKTFLRLDIKYDFAMKINPTDTVGNQTAQINTFTLEARYNRQKKSTINSSIAYSTIKYNDKNYPNEQLQYAMLNGLQNGNNLVWSISFSQNLINNLQLTVSYDGRMTGFEPSDKSTMKPIHTGRAELRALF